MKLKLAASALAATMLTAPAMGAETLTAVFTTPTGGQTVWMYSGIVNVTVSGTGFSAGSTINDAFYFTGSQTQPGTYYTLTFGTSPLVPFNPAQEAKNFLVGPVPAYSPTNTYSFKLDTKTAVPSILYFGVSDGQFSDNGGAFRITVSQGVPEPAAWGLLILGFGAIGGAMRRRRTAVSFA